KVHAHGALAGAELWYGGLRCSNYFTREVSLDLGSYPAPEGHPFQTRAMDKTDIRNLRRWHKKAALRAREAGYDIVYVYATHGYLLSHFLNPVMNTRGDEYGGSLQNRTRLVRELIEETKEAVGDRCAVAVRFACDEKIVEDGVPEFGERKEMFAMMADLPDLWDINVADYDLEMGSSRFVKEGALEAYMRDFKAMTSKPVVTVGRFTSPDTMVRQIKQGVVDLIGAARPSIADPFLPKKIEEGRLWEIRECIGCNICYSGDSLGVPVRCTQNPTMGEEWRKGWHPEKMQPKRSDARVLVVGAGPAGLEAARALGARGYDVMLAEATRVLGGRVAREASLPGMSEYIRVRDYREQQLLEMPNVEIFRESPMTAQDIKDVEPDHVILATGATWRRQLFNHRIYADVATPEAADRVFTPDDIMDGKLPKGPTVLFDADGYYMGVAIAEKLRQADVPVTMVTESDTIGSWAGKTSENWRMRARIMALGVEIVPSHSMGVFDGATVTLSCAYTEAEKVLPAANLVLVGQRLSNDTLFHELTDAPFSVTRIGDCEAPGIVAQAVYSGHRVARELEETVNIDDPLRHERVDLGPKPEKAETTDPQKKYLETLLLYYEEEIMGDAEFRAFAELFDAPDRKEKMTLLADVERHAAKLVRPLVEKYDLTPRSVGELQAMGRDYVKTAHQDWDALIGYMHKSFPAYMDDFHGLEAMAPADDLPALKLLTEHEAAAIDFLNREVAGDAASTQPLKDYLALEPVPV
ncbi:MAG: FAD-dependent oxidoreductase, partial [Pseudomonadota bacterium]